MSIWTIWKTISSGSDAPPEGAALAASAMDFWRLRWILVGVEPQAFPGRDCRRDDGKAGIGAPRVPWLGKEIAQPSNRLSKTLHNQSGRP